MRGAARGEWQGHNESKHDVKEACELGRRAVWCADPVSPCPFGPWRRRAVAQHHNPNDTHTRNHHMLQVDSHAAPAARPMALASTPPLLLLSAVFRCRCCSTVQRGSALPAAHTHPHTLDLKKSLLNHTVLCQSVTRALHALHARHLSPTPRSAATEPTPFLRPPAAFARGSLAIHGYQHCSSRVQWPGTPLGVDVLARCEEQR